MPPRSCPRRFSSLRLPPMWTGSQIRQVGTHEALSSSTITPQGITRAAMHILHIAAAAAALQGIQQVGLGPRSMAL